MTATAIEPANAGARGCRAGRMDPHGERRRPEAYRKRHTWVFPKLAMLPSEYRSLTPTECPTPSARLEQE